MKILRSLLQTSYKLQYAGNLAVDSHAMNFDRLVRPRVENLALLGNIGRPDHPRTKDFLQYCANNWKQVYWIPGPHELTNVKEQKKKEYYHKKIERCQTLATDTDVSFIIQSEIPIPYTSISLLGSTLWTHMRSRIAGQPEFESIYKYTSLGLSRLTPNTYKTWHYEDFNFYLDKTKYDKKTTFLVLSHHLPCSSILSTGLSTETYCRLDLDVNHLGRYFRPNVAAWLSGATGSCASGNFGSTPGKQTFCSVNSCFEYPFTEEMKPHPGYRNDMFVEIVSRFHGLPAFQEQKVTRGHFHGFPEISLNQSKLSLLTA